MSTACEYSIGESVYSFRSLQSKDSVGTDVTFCHGVDRVKLLHLLVAEHTIVFTSSVASHWREAYSCKECGLFEGEITFLLLFMSQLSYVQATCAETACVMKRLSNFLSSDALHIHVINPLLSLSTRTFDMYYNPFPITVHVAVLISRAREIKPVKTHLLH